MKTARTIVLELDESAPVDTASFAARRSLAALRGFNPAATLVASGSRARVDALLAADLAAYADAVAAPGIAAADVRRWSRDHPGLQIWTTVAFSAFDGLLDASAVRPAGASSLLIWPPVPITAELLEDLRLLADLFPERLVPLADVRVRCDPPEVCAVEAFQRADTLATIFLVRRRSDGRASVVVPASRAELFALIARRGETGGLLPLAPILPDASGALRIWIPPAAHLVARVPSEQDRVSEDVSVVGARQLTVEEIVARHQAAAARQARVVRQLITRARTILTFEVPAFPAPMTIQADTTLFQGDGPVDIAQRNVTVNGVAFTGSKVPRLPLIEPERVSAPPLAITLGRAYAYRLRGRERVGDRECHVVWFEPRAAGESLFRGRAWVDTQTFALVRVDAVQTDLRGPITSSQQIEEFAPQSIEGEVLWLLSRSEIRQIYQGAGVTTPIHRLMVVEAHEVNPPDLAARRRAALASDAVMLRETPQGLRYLQRGEDRGRRDPGQVREVAGRATRVRTLAGGVVIDPNITRPLPFAGLNYTDFDLLGTGTQFNAFFGGAFGNFAFNVPSIAGTRWQLTGSGFGILTHYNDRSFRAGRERHEENIRQRPAHVRTGVVRPLTARTAARAEYMFDYVALGVGETTAIDFAVPSDQVVHGARLSLETQRRGWRLEGWWNPARRMGWRAWGRPGSGDYDERHADFQRFGVYAYRPWVFSPRVLLRVEGSVMAGGDLDRFSRYAFGTFENRLTGYPSASIRYDRGGALRTVLVWQTGGRLRLDGFADAALVIDPGFGRKYRGYPGVGTALEAPGPFGLLLGAEWGHGFRGLNSDGTRGTDVIRVTAYKVF